MFLSTYVKRLLRDTVHCCAKVLVIATHAHELHVAYD